MLACLHLQVFASHLLRCFLSLLHLIVKLRHCSSARGPLSALFSDFHFSAPTVPHPPGISLAPSTSLHFIHLINPHGRVHSNIAISMKRSPTLTGQDRRPALVGCLPIIMLSSVRTCSSPGQQAIGLTEVPQNRGLTILFQIKILKRKREWPYRKRDTGNYR